VAQGRLIGAAVLLSAASVITEAALPAGNPALSVLNATVPITFASIAPALRRPVLVPALALSTAAAWILATLVGASALPQGLVDGVGLLHRVALAGLVSLYPQGERRFTLALLAAGTVAVFLPGAAGAWSTTALLGLGGLGAALRAVRGAAVLRAARGVAALAGATATTGAALAASGAIRRRRRRRSTTR
jgi:hypothetical protein